MAVLLEMNIPSYQSSAEDARGTPKETEGDRPRASLIMGGRVGKGRWTSGLPLRQVRLGPDLDLGVSE
jgi:hypothetical protein